MSTALRQSTASQEIILGPFLDETDGITPVTDLTIANTDIKIWKHGTTTEANKNSGGGTHIAGGRYSAVLDATDSDTAGNIEVNVHMSGALPVKFKGFVYPTAVYDLTIGATTLGTQQTGDAFARLGAPAGASVSADVAAIKAETASILTDTGTTLDGKLNTIDSNVDAILVDTGTTLQAELDGIQADTEDIQTKIGTPAGASVSADVAAVKAETASILTDTGTTLDGKIDAIDTVVDAVKVQTDKLTFTVANQVDANIQSVNDVAITGDGSGTPFGVA